MLSTISNPYKRNNLALDPRGSQLSKHRPLVCDSDGKEDPTVSRIALSSPPSEQA